MWDEAYPSSHRPHPVQNIVRVNVAQLENTGQANPLHPPPPPLRTRNSRLSLALRFELELEAPLRQVYAVVAAREVLMDVIISESRG